jgi:hypothetical protein
LMASLLTDALAVSTRAMHGPRSDHPAQTFRKDVPHLPESLCIGIEMREFVESH